MAKFAEVRTHPRERGSYSVTTVVLILEVDPFGSAITIRGFDIGGRSTGVSRPSSIDEALLDARRYGITEHDWREIPSREVDRVKYAVSQVTANELELDCVVLGWSVAGITAARELVEHGAKAAIFDLAGDVPLLARVLIGGREAWSWEQAQRDALDRAGAYRFPSVTFEHAQPEGRHRFSIWSGVGEITVSARLVLDASVRRSRAQSERFKAADLVHSGILTNGSQALYGAACVIGSGPWAVEQARVAWRASQAEPVLLLEGGADLEVPVEADVRRGADVVSIGVDEPSRMLEVRFLHAGVAETLLFDHVVLAEEPDRGDHAADLRCGADAPLLDDARQRDEGVRAAQRLLARL